jgi:hypothetical protein
MVLFIFCFLLGPNLNDKLDGGSLIKETAQPGSNVYHALSNVVKFFQIFN